MDDKELEQLAKPLVRRIYHVDPGETLLDVARRFAEAATGFVADMDEVREMLAKEEHDGQGSG